MEAVVLNDKSVLEILSKDYIVVSLYVDDRRGLDEPFTDKNGLVYTEIGEKWSYLQESKFGALSQPYYVLVDSDGQPLNGAYAFDKKVDKFIGFLNEGLNNFKNEGEDAEK